LLSQSGMAVRGGHNCSGREQTPESGIQIPGLGFLPFGPTDDRWS
jgi:hypothetical protein